MGEAALKSESLAEMRDGILRLADEVERLKEHKQNLLAAQSTARERLKAASDQAADQASDAIVAGDLSAATTLSEALIEARQAEAAVAEQIKTCDIGILRRNRQHSELLQEYRAAYNSAANALVRSKLGPAERKMRKAVIEWCGYQSIHLGHLVGPEAASHKLNGETPTAARAEVQEFRDALLSAEGIGEKL